MPEYFDPNDLLLPPGIITPPRDLNNSTSGGVFDVFSTNAGLSSMNRAREQLQEELSYLNNIRRMIRDTALAGGASWEDANAAATAAVPLPSASSTNELDILEDTTGDDTTIVNTTEPINDTTEEEPTLADIIAGWLERQVGPVTQEKIKGVLDRYGKTVEDFNEAVKDVPGIPSFEDFVTEGEPVVTNTGTTTTTGGTTTTTNGGTTTTTNGGTPTPTTTGGGDGGLNGPVETPKIIPQLPQLPETETATGGLLFGLPSPTRTTDEVLAADLFKLDVNIPLVQRLTQYSPMAAPQYMLSGISQRYKV